jgi:hypothetical protein
MLAQIRYAMPYHSFLGISMQHTAATIWVRKNYVGCCSSYEFFLIDHGAQNSLLEGWFAAYTQPIPQEHVLHLATPRPTRSLRETERRAPADCRMATGSSPLCKIWPFSTKNLSGYSLRIFNSAPSALFWSSLLFTRVAAFIKSIILICTNSHQAYNYSIIDPSFHPIPTFPGRKGQNKKPTQIPPIKFLIIRSE